MQEPPLNEKRSLVGYVYHYPISAAVSKELRKNSDSSFIYRHVDEPQ